MGARKHLTYYLAVATSLFIFTESYGQQIAIRNNLLYDATLTPNLGIEYKLDSAWSVGLNAGLNAWDIDKDKNKKWRHLMLSPNVRYYLPRRDSLSRSPFPALFPAGTTRFLGIHAVYSHYNVGNVSFPFGLYSDVKDHRLQGDLVALGGSFGYNWRLNDRWHIEAELGAALGYTWYKEYECDHCGSYLGKENKVFLLPKLGLNLVYYLGRRPEAPAAPATPVAPVVEKKPIMLHVYNVADNTGRAGILQTDNPVLEHISNYRPYDRTRILRKEKGALYVHFPLSQSILQHDFRGNASVLDRIVNITRQIMADTTSTVKKIQIIGLASIEGTAVSNEQLAADRATALKKYIQQHVATPDSLYDLCNGGEAWAELRDQVNDAQFDGRDQVLNIIDTETDLERREQQLRSLNQGSTFQYIKEQLLPDQRNSGYLRIYYDYVPDANAAVINRASELLRNNSADSHRQALTLLNSVSNDQRAQNALGVALWLNGQKAEALTCFRRAAANGDNDAQENLRMLESETK